jgi:hypothetical protein
MLLIERDPRFNFFAIYIFLKAFDIQPKYLGVSVEPTSDISGFTPKRLLPIKRVMHLQKRACRPAASAPTLLRARADE